MKIDSKCPKLMCNCPAEETGEIGIGLRMIAAAGTGQADGEGERGYTEVHVCQVSAVKKTTINERGE